MSKTKHRISAVHEKDLKKLLESLDYLDEVNLGYINCKFCETKITLENLQCLYPSNDAIVFCCDNIQCYQQALRESGGEQPKNGWLADCNNYPIDINPLGCACFIGV